MRHPALIIAVATASLGGLPVEASQDAGIVGAWRLNPELSTPVPQGPREGERPRGRGPGGGGPPGGGRGMPGMPGMGRGPSETDMRRLRVIMRRMSEPPASLVIVRDGLKVSVTDGDGRSVSYLTDGRKEERVTGDGEFTSRARFEGAVLVIEEDFGGGVKLTTRASPIVSEGRERLEVALKATGLPKPPGGGRPPGGDDERPNRGPMDSATRVYERADR